MNSLRTIKLILARSRNLSTKSVPKHIEFPEIVSTGVSQNVVYLDKNVNFGGN